VHVHVYVYVYVYVHVYVHVHVFAACIISLANLEKDVDAYVKHATRPTPANIPSHSFPFPLLSLLHRNISSYWTATTPED